MGWYDANPANLWPHPPEAVAARYVAAMGGRDGALAVARQAWDDGDYRWCAEVGKHLVFADDTDAEARALLADALEQLGFGAENGTWRNAFLAGATELRSGNFGTPATDVARHGLRAQRVAGLRQHRRAHRRPAGVGRAPR